MRNQLPKINLVKGNVKLQAEMPASVLARWQPEIHAASDEDDATLNIYSSIGEDFWTGEGMTAKIVSAVLRKNKGKDITVNINSPGGDFFEGVAIYNMLREHDGNINVRVVGLAASAASVIAMAGDSIKVAEAGFLMIHNAWLMAIGNRHDLTEAADMLARFDESMIAVYSKRSGQDEKAVAKLMDNETWLSGKESIERGFADALLDSDELELEKSAEPEYNAALKKVDIAMAKQGIPRSERRQLLKELKGTQAAANQNPDITPCAGEDDLSNALEGILAKLNQ